MAKNKQPKADKQDKLYIKNNPDRKRDETAYDQVKAPGKGIMPSLDTPFQPKEVEHAALLAGAHSDKQRANLVLQLQQAYGNAYVQRLLKSNALQAKLSVNPPDDIYEREADRTADIVMQAFTIQRQEVPEEEELTTKLATEVQRQEVPEEEELVTKPAMDHPSLASEDLETKINMACSSAQPLDESVRAPMEQVFGADFSGVRIHTDANADVLNQSLQARAFTTGEDIFFRSGEYRPDVSSGQRLLAHELTHVVQQQGSVQTDRESVGRVDDAFEQKAAQVGEALSHGRQVSIGTVTGVPAIQLAVEEKKKGKGKGGKKGKGKDEGGDKEDEKLELSPQWKGRVRNYIELALEAITDEKPPKYSVAKDCCEEAKEGIDKTIEEFKISGELKRMMDDLYNDLTKIVWELGAEKPVGAKILGALRVAQKKAEDIAKAILAS